MTVMTPEATQNTPRPVGFALFNIIAGAVGLFAAFELLTEFIKTLKDVDYVPNCSISVLVTCGPNMGSWQGSVFGFSNTILGIAAFTAPIFVGMALLAGARFAPWFWWLYQTGLLFGFGFVLWLAHQSIFALGVLCPWCMVVWAVMIPLWWIGFLRPHAVGDVPHSARTAGIFTTLYQWSWVIILVCYALIAMVAQLQLDWFGEFRRM